MATSAPASTTLLVTGGAGFIGSALLRHLAADGSSRLVNVDNLTYSGNLDSLAGVRPGPGYAFEKVDICDVAELSGIFERHRPTAILHLAAETHVDRSIDSPEPFVRTNVAGTSALLEVATAYYRRLPEESARRFRFLHVSTDEVYGPVAAPEAATEEAPYRPSSPYSSTKAASDHLVRAWHRTYGLPVLLTVSSNNYGPYQFPEKFIPHMILSALGERPLPIYGSGAQKREWLHVDDHVRALCLILQRGVVGETYNIGGSAVLANLDVARRICRLLDVACPRRQSGLTYEDLITFVADRPGHDARYSLDSGKIRNRLGWNPTINFEEGLDRTVHWYLEHRDWWTRVLERYRLERSGVPRMGRH